MTTLVKIPFKPRPQQLEALRRIAKARFSVLVCHRRFGKTVLGVNWLQQGALRNPNPRPRTAYIGPTYRQSKAVAWDYCQHYARPVPAVEFNQSELRVDYPNAGQLRLYGADNPDSLRGIYLDRAHLDEYGMHPAKTFTEVISATLVDRGGTALFTGTPNGKNQFFDIARHAQEEMAAGNPDWYFAEYKASQTGLLDEGYLKAARAIMTADEYAQEFECSFEAAVKGAIYSKELEEARTAGRVGAVPYDPSLPVDTDWDLGVGDAMAIWFTQTARGSTEVRVIDYYEASGEGFPHYAKVLQGTADLKVNGQPTGEWRRAYAYGKHWAPHDIKVREMGSGRSRLEVAANMGITFSVTPRLHDKADGEVEEGIHAVRMFLPRCWFDQVKCKAGLEAMQHYRRDYNQRLNEFKATPVHDWASHGADAFRGLAVRHRVAAILKPAPAAYRPKSAWG